MIPAMRAWLSAWVAALAVLCVAAGAVAQEPASVEDELSSLRELVLMARYEEAREPSRELLARTDLSPSERLAALEVRALLQIAERNTPGADETLRELYSRDPDYRMSDPEASPVVIDAFNRARAARPTPVPVQIEQSADVVAGDDPVVAIRIVDGQGAVTGLTVSYRTEDEVDYNRVGPRLRDGAARARLALARSSNASRIAYYVEALAPSGASLASVGSAAEPLWIETGESGDGAGGGGGGGGGGEGGTTVDSGLLGQWWFWTAVGAVVVGAVVIAIAVATSGSQTEGSLGSGVLR